MSRLPILLALLFALLAAGGCSDGNSKAPDVDTAHPPTWVLRHPDEARQRLVDCTACHGNAFQGSAEAVSCFACHFAPPGETSRFFVHPPEWNNVIVDHQAFPRGYSWTRCANAACHGGALEGGTAGPSCFLAGCHSQGPPAPHPTGFYFLPANHGPTAKSDQLYCRNCHGRPPAAYDGGFVADPAILDRLLGSCSLFFCHPSAQAHPTRWQGENDADLTYAATHRDVNRQAIGVSCALCHRTDAPGSGPAAAAPSCFAAQFVNADGSATGCHPQGP